MFLQKEKRDANWRQSLRKASYFRDTSGSWCWKDIFLSFFESSLSSANLTGGRFYPSQKAAWRVFPPKWWTDGKILKSFLMKFISVWKQTHRTRLSAGTQHLSAWARSLMPIGGHVCLNPATKSRLCERRWRMAPMAGVSPEVRWFLPPDCQETHPRAEGAGTVMALFVAPTFVYRQWGEGEGG